MDDNRRWAIVGGGWYSQHDVGRQVLSLPTSILLVVINESEEHGGVKIKRVVAVLYTTER